MKTLICVIIIIGCWMHFLGAMSQRCILCSYGVQIENFEEKFSVKIVPHDRDFSYQVEGGGVAGCICLICSKFLEATSGDLIEISFQNQDQKYIHKQCFDGYLQRGMYYKQPVCQQCSGKITESFKVAALENFKNSARSKLTMGCCAFSSCIIFFVVIALYLHWIS